MQSASPKRVPLGVGPKQSRAWHSRELGKRHMRSSLASGKSATPPARCIHRPQRDTSSAEYRLLVSLAPVGASRELSSRRSPALAPHTCAVSPTFRYGAFLFVALALADSSSARLTTYDRKHTSARPQSDANPTLIDPICRRYQTLSLLTYVSPALSPQTDDSAANPPRKQAFYNGSTGFPDCFIGGAFKYHRGPL